MRSYFSTVALVLIASLFLACGLGCLHISAVIAASAGYAPVANLEAFGRWPDPEDLRRTWQTHARFRYGGFVLIVLALPFGVLAARSFRRARNVRE